MQNHWERVRVGSRIAVYFEEQRCFYACKVLKKEGSNFQVKYEDETLEWRELAKSKFRWDDNEESSDEEASNSEDVGAVKVGMRKFVDYEAIEAKGDKEDEEEDWEEDGNEY